MIAPEEMVVTVTHGGYVKRNPKIAVQGAAARRTRHHRRGHARRRLRGAAVRGVDPRHAVDVHQQGARLLQEGVGGAAGGPHRQGQGVRQPAPAARERTRGGAAAGARVLRGRVRGHGHARAAPSRRRRWTLFANIRGSGIIALSIADNDDLVGVRITEGASDLLLGTRNGWAIRFREENVRPMGRTARGVRGIRLRERRRGGRHGGDPARRAGDAADRVREGLRQAHADVRLPDQEPRRQGRHHHQDQRAQRQGGRRCASSPTKTT